MHGPMNMKFKKKLYVVNILPGKIFTRRGFNSVVTLPEVDYGAEANTFRPS